MSVHASFIAAKIFCAGLFLVTLLSGCNDLKMPDVGLPDTATPEPSAPVETTPPPVPIPVSPEQVIANVLGKQSMSLTDDDLATLAALESGLDTIEELDLRTATISSAGLNSLAALPKLRKLDVQSMNLSDRKWDGLANLKSLEWLNLTMTATNDEALTHVGRLTGLKHLNLAKTQVTDDGFAALMSLSALEELDISGMELSGTCLQGLGAKGAKAPLRIITASGSMFGYQGFVHLKDFPTLEELHVSGCSVTDGSMEGLKRLNKVRILNLSGNQISDEGMAGLNSLDDLEELYLKDNRSVSDKGIVRLSRLKKLKTVDFENTSISLDGVQKLKKAVPACVIRIQQQEF